MRIVREESKHNKIGVESVETVTRVGIAERSQTNCQSQVDETLNA